MCDFIAQYVMRQEVRFWNDLFLSLWKVLSVYDVLNEIRHEHTGKKKFGGQKLVHVIFVSKIAVPVQFQNN